MEEVCDAIIERKESISRCSSALSACVIRYELNIPTQYSGVLTPLNSCEQKERFLKRNLTPEFKLLPSINIVETAILSETANINFNLFREAKRILDTVINRFKTIDAFIEASFGKAITVEQATEKIISYINDEALPTPLEIIWCDELIGSALMCSTKVDPSTGSTKKRKFTVLLKTTAENTYLREQGISCLMDHEIGTHYHRSYNEGLQPWYLRRSDFGLTPISSYELVKIEEGLACLNTAYNAKYPFLGVPALLYYGSCMAEYLPFKDLYEHLGKYVKNDEQLWKHCMRIKRCLGNQYECGGYGKDQRYFEGAITILREQLNINFRHLMAGKLTLKDVPIAEKLMITDNIHLPSFMKPMRRYRTNLRQMAYLNGINIYPKRTKTSYLEPVVIQSATPGNLKKDLTGQGVDLIVQSSEQERKSNQIKDQSTTIGSKKYVQNLAMPKNVVAKNTASAKRYTATNRIAISKTSTHKTVNSTCLLENIRSSTANLVGNLKHNPALSYYNINNQEIIDLTPASCITRPPIKSCRTKQIDNARPLHLKDADRLSTLESMSFSSQLKTCGCNLFTHGRQLNGELKNEPILTPIILEIDMRHPVLDAFQ